MYPILFKIGFFTVYTYGFMIAVAFLVCSFLLSKEFKRIGIKEDLAVDLSVYLLIFGIIGARFLHVLLNAGYYFYDVKEIFMLQHGGLAWQGGVILAFIAGLFFMKKQNLIMGATCDAVVPYVALGQSIGRIGCYLNGCCYGKATDSFFGVIFPGMTQQVHPTELYLSFFLLIVFVILKKKEEKKVFNWQIFSLYLILYAVVRFSIDFLRGDLHPVFFGLSVSQFICAVLFLAGIIIYKTAKSAKVS
ncbi:MAG: prolipoprotein diacylglyceryl transferase [Candidatus Omnitrophota bacterium]